ncbi:MAG: FTR1 family protein [Clostridiaceae bacterium]
MFAPFLICLREGIEIFLVVIPMVVYFNKNKMYGMSRSVFKGGALGTILSAIIGSVIFSQAALLNGPAGDLFDGVLGIILAGLVLYSVVILRKNKFFDITPNQQFVALSKKGIFIIAAITFFRELLEATLFILTSSAKSPVLVAGASILGLICAAFIVYIIAKGISNLNINIVFYVLNLFLIGLGAFYFADGLEVLLGGYIPEIFKFGILVYAVPSYFLMVKKDLKKYINSNKIK